MGCTASRVENEDTVRRCRERRRLMKEAVHARRHLASAHSDYLRSLRVAAAALTRFARGEPLSVSQHAPPVLLRSSAAASLRPPTPLPPPFAFPFSSFSPSPSPSFQLPHVLPASVAANANFRKPSPAAPAEHFAAVNPTYAATPSHSSSAWSTWDWENFYPPSPPDSEFYDRRRAELEEKNRQQQHHLPLEVEEVDEGGQGGREEVHCHDWGEHYASSASSSTGSDGERDDEEEDKYSRSTGIAARSGYDGASEPTLVTPTEIGSSAAAEVKSRRWWARSDARPLPVQWNAGREMVSCSSGATGELKMVVRHCDLAEIVAAIEEYFNKAADAGDAVSNLLETGRDRSMSHLKRTVYHSNSVLSALSSSWTSKPPLAIRYQLDTEAMQSVGGKKSHCSTLERLLAWEMKLYEEVKAREGVKIEHEKKLSTFQSLECRGKEDAKFYKTQASIKQLQSLIIVTSQAVTTTSSAIMKVRDNELAPQLVEFCFNLLNMWRQMNQFHVAQNHVVQQVRGLVNRSSSGEYTSDLHRLTTRELEAAISAWHSNFDRLIKYQRDYVNALYGWLKLTLLQVSSDNPQRDHSSPLSMALAAFCDEWKQALHRLPDKVASEAIKSFINVIHVIYTKQAEEQKIKKLAETYSKELEKKSTALRSIEKKYYQSYSMVGIGIPSRGRENDGHVLDTRDPLAEKKIEIAACRRRVEDEMARHAKAVDVTRSMTLNNIQTGLPGVFQAIAGFSGMFVEALEGVCRQAGSIY